MKNFLTVTLLCLFWANAVLLNSCSRPDPDEPQTAEDQLPDITTSGKNTFGCLVNGKPYVMCAKWPDNDPIFGGSNPLHIESGDISTGGYYVYIRTVDRYSEDDSKHFEIFDIVVRLNEQNSPILPFITYVDLTNYPCGVNQDFIFDSTSVANFININKIDYTERILAGEFEFDLYTPGCTDTIKIRKGRFDVKF